MSAAGNGEGGSPVCRVRGMAPQLGLKAGVWAGGICLFENGIHVPRRHLFAIFGADGRVHSIDSVFVQVLGQEPFTRGTSHQGRWEG
jgi:hypothetical protein